MLVDQILVEIAMVDQTDRFNDLAGRPHRWDLDWGFLPMTSFNWWLVNLHRPLRWFGKHQEMQVIEIYEPN